MSWLIQALLQPLVLQQLQLLLLPPRLVCICECFRLHSVAMASDTLLIIHFCAKLSLFSARCNIHVYISRLCYDVSVRLSVTEVHWVAVHAGNSGCASQRSWSHHTIPNKHGCHRWRGHLALATARPSCIIWKRRKCTSSVILFWFYQTTAISPHSTDHAWIANLWFLVSVCWWVSAPAIELSASVWLPLFPCLT